jgi:hypothetical protein
MVGLSLDNADAATHNIHKSEDRDGDFAILLVLAKVNTLSLYALEVNIKSPLPSAEGMNPQRCP